jgi:formamidopyrimidine-DNA glycosylase
MDEVKHLTGKQLTLLETVYDIKEVNGKIKKIYTHGKKIIIQVDNNYLIFSFGMTGHLSFNKEDRALKSFKAIFSIGDIFLVFLDTRGFGSIEFSSNLISIEALGPDLLDCSLTEYITSVEWRKLFKNSKRKMHDYLMDQHIIAGIGNYLSSEILFYAGIHPKRLVNSLQEHEIETLRIKAHELIRFSYLSGGFTIESFSSPLGLKGNYKSAVYANTSVYNSGEKKVVSEKILSRTAYWCPETQFI